MENFIKNLKASKTVEEVCEKVETYIEQFSWFKFLKWEQFNVYDLLMCYDLMEDDDTTIWKEETPAEEKEKGTEIIVAIRNAIIVVD